VRRGLAFVGITVALAACRDEPPKRAAEQPPARPASAAADAAPDAREDAAPAAVRSGDRHARAAARRSHVVKRARGTLARSDDRAIVVSRPDAAPLTLRVAPGTSVTLDGRPARAEALPPGADVRAAYRSGDGGRPTAIVIEAQRRGDAAPGGAGAPAAGDWVTSPEPAQPGGG
jgi:hypothetical protein